MRRGSRRRRRPAGGSCSALRQERVNRHSMTGGRHVSPTWRSKSTSQMSLIVHAAECRIVPASMNRVMYLASVHPSGRSGSASSQPHTARVVSHCEVERVQRRRACGPPDEVGADGELVHARELPVRLPPPLRLLRHSHGLGELLPLLERRLLSGGARHCRGERAERDEEARARSASLKYLLQRFARSAFCRSSHHSCGAPSTKSRQASPLDRRAGVRVAAIGKSGVGARALAPRTTPTAVNGGTRQTGFPPDALMRR